ncbi:xaa-Pro aminopeptidase 1-like, partial [Stegodyphus dumicola]|uniref:xaa-Pro aminopeptidase 1-like n=1 Tax=Stegodyphus dumicola TaxID=202533 RepID=UPI0015AF4517
SEYIAACDERRAYVTGFTGSAGTAIVTENHAALWTDGRYFLQAEQQLDGNWILMKDGLTETPSESKWLCNVLPVASRVGVDPFLMPFYSWQTLSKQLKSEGHILIPVQQNLVDIIWNGRPEPPLKTIECLPIEYTGKTWQEKITIVREEMVSNKASVLVLTALDEIAYLFNLRGSDIEYNPVFFSYAVVTLTSVHLFIDERKLTPAVIKYLQEGDSHNLQMHPYESIIDVLSSIFNDIDEGKIWISDKSSYALVSLVPK